MGTLFEFSNFYTINENAKWAYSNIVANVKLNLVVCKMKIHLEVKV